MPENPAPIRKSARPALLSIATHGVLVIVLIFLARPSGNLAKGEPHRTVSVVIADASELETEYLTENDVPDDPDEASEQEAAPDAAASPAPQLPEPSQAETKTNPTPLPSPQTDASQFTERFQPTGATSEYKLTKEDLDMIAADQRLLKSRQPVGDPTSISVFGTGKLTGRTFVFVLDRSQSMGGSGLGVLFRAEKEITNAVAKLEKHHLFQIAAYHDRSTTLSRRQLLKATPENKQKVAGFIARLAAFGATEHENGLTTALTFRPDVIVLLTDGGYPTLNASQLKTAQLMAGNRNGKKRTEIHCVQFGFGANQQPRNFMVELAKQNHGTYRYVDVTEWDD